MLSLTVPQCTGLGTLAQCAPCFASAACAEGLECHTTARRCVPPGSDAGDCPEEGAGCNEECSIGVYAQDCAHHTRHRPHLCTPPMACIPRNGASRTHLVTRNNWTHHTLPPPPPCINYASVQATVGVGTVIIVYVNLITYEM